MAPRVEIAQQAFADGEQIRARLAQLGQWRRVAQDAQKGVLAEVRRIPRIAHAPAQPGFQPAAVLAIQLLQALLRR